MIKLIGKYTTADIMIDIVELDCISQIIKMINHPVFTNPVKIMPDCHSGKGSCIGFTMLINDKIIPNLVSVDIGCGMLSVNIGNIRIEHLHFDKKVRELIPFGMNIHNKAVSNLYGFNIKYFESMCKRIGLDPGYALRSVGTLGGGNHFIEIGKSVNNGDIWLTVHSGSRHLGKKVCEYWQKVATDRLKPDMGKLIENVKQSFPKKEWEREIRKVREENKQYKRSELDSIDGEDMEGYLSDMKFAQEYAQENRATTMNIMLKILKVKNPKEIIETVHNFISFKDNIIRKGAIESYVGQKMIIPMNMRDGIFVCEGKSNPDWNFSAPHGAGRVMSRSKAKQELSLKKMRDDMDGIFSTSINKDTLDESPDAYKDSKIIEEAIEPTANIVDRLIPIHNMKDSVGKERD